MDENFEYFLEKFQPVSDRVQPTGAQIGAFRGKLPDQLLSYWAETGWCACADGLLWLVNPDDYAATVADWLDGAGLAAGDFHAIARSAFGRLLLWNKEQGQAATIDPLFSQIMTYAADRFVAEGDETFAVSSFFAALRTKAFDIDDVDDKPLFKRALKKLGKLKEDEMYGFEPALALGGLPTLANLARVKLVEHLALLRQLDDIEILHIDVSARL